jgi:hypothetical protein
MAMPRWQQGRAGALAFRATTHRPPPLNGRDVIEFTSSENAVLVDDPVTPLLQPPVARSLSVGVDDRPWKQSSTMFARCPASYVSRADATLPPERNQWAGGILEAFVFGWPRPNAAEVAEFVARSMTTNSTAPVLWVQRLDKDYVSSGAASRRTSRYTAHPTAASSDHRTKLSTHTRPIKDCESQGPAASS